MSVNQQWNGMCCLLKFTTIASAGCVALAWWLEQERPSTPEQFVHWLQQLIYDISVSTLKLKK